MIDLDTIEEVDEFDGENGFCYGYDPVKDEWLWDWVSIETLYDEGRDDLVAWFHSA